MVTDDNTKATLYAHQAFKNMGKADKIRACYQHACLCWVSNEQMTNTSLRKRFGISDANYAIASRIIADTLAEGLVKPHDASSTSKRQAKYDPFWA
jgi:predicted HTH transcriptional regulator